MLSVGTQLGPYTILAPVASQGNQPQSKWIQYQAHSVRIARRQPVMARHYRPSSGFSIRLRFKGIQYLDTTGAALGFDSSPFHIVLDIREGRKREREVDAQTTFEKYLEGVVKATEEVDRRLAVSTANA